jgi:hypothetical protein
MEVLSKDGYVGRITCECPVSGEEVTFLVERSSRAGSNGYKTLSICQRNTKEYAASMAARNTNVRKVEILTISTVVDSSEEITADNW